jgi:hypothetical protein
VWLECGWIRMWVYLEIRMWVCLDSNAGAYSFECGCVCIRMGWVLIRMRVCLREYASNETYKQTY